VIKLTRLDKREIIISVHQIETLEATPDTVITMISGRKYLVREKVEEIIQAAVDYRCRLGFSAAQESEPAAGSVEIK